MQRRILRIEPVLGLAREICEDIKVGTPGNLGVFAIGKKIEERTSDLFVDVSGINVRDLPGAKLVTMTATQSEWFGILR